MSIDFLLRMQDGEQEVVSTWKNSEKESRVKN